MTGIRKLLVGISASTILVGSSLLLAQPGEDATADPETPEVTAPLSETANLSSEEMRAGAATNLTELRTMLGRLVELRQVARQSNDIIKLNCVNDQLLLYKQVVNLAEKAQTELVEAIAQDSQNSAESRHYYGQVVLANEKGADIRREAEGCIGEEMVFLGPTEVTLDAPPVNGPGEGPILDWDPPVYASPFN